MGGVSKRSIYGSVCNIQNIHKSFSLRLRKLDSLTHTGEFHFSTQLTALSLLSCLNSARGLGSLDGFSGQRAQSSSCVWSQEFCSPFPAGSCRNCGNSRCSLVSKPRWSSTRLHWARVSSSTRTETQQMKRSVLLLCAHGFV